MFTPEIKVFIAGEARKCWFMGIREERYGYQAVLHWSLPSRSTTVRSHAWFKKLTITGDTKPVVEGDFRWVGDMEVVNPMEGGYIVFACLEDVDTSGRWNSGRYTRLLYKGGKKSEVLFEHKEGNAHYRVVLLPAALSAVVVEEGSFDQSSATKGYRNSLPMGGLPLLNLSGVGRYFDGTPQGGSTIIIA